METEPMNITLENIRDFLRTKNFFIEKKEEFLEFEKKTSIYYTIKEIGTTEITTDNGYLHLFINEKNEDDYISQLPTKQRKAFKTLKQITRMPCWYCYISWINGSRKYRNIGKLLMLYMMLDLSQDNRLFIIILSNSSGKPDTYTIFGFVKVNDDREIMSSLLLPQIQRNLYSLLFT